MHKRRYKTRLLGRVVRNLDSLIATGQAPPRVPRGGGLDQGGQAYLLDAARIILEEWGRITPVQIANGWLTADMLPSEAVAEVRLQLHGVVPAAENIDNVVSELGSLLASSSLRRDFEDRSLAERVRAVEEWFLAEDDVEAVYATVDMVLAGEDEEWYVRFFPLSCTVLWSCCVNLCAFLLFLFHTGCVVRLR